MPSDRTSGHVMPRDTQLRRRRSGKHAAAMLAAACVLVSVAGGCSTIKSLFGSPSAPAAQSPAAQSATGSSTIISSGQRSASPAPASSTVAASGTDVSTPPASLPSTTTPPVDAYGAVRPEQPAQVAAVTPVVPALARITFHDEGYDSDVACDPTGRWIIFASTRHSAHANLFIQSLDGASVSQITNDDADHANPVFSPDGKTIAFCSTGNAGNWEIDLADRTGGNLHCITHGDWQYLHPSFSPDGQRMVYCAQAKPGDPWLLWVMDMQSGQCRMLGPGLFPVWSPYRGEDRIAFQKAVPQNSRRFSLWTMKLMEGTPCDVRSIAACGNAAVVCPTWSPDGSRIAFATVMEPMTSAAAATGAAANAPALQAIWHASADGSDRHCLTDGRGSAMTPFWGVNRIFFVSDRGGVDSVWAIRAPENSTMTFSASAGGN